MHAYLIIYNIQAIRPGKYTADIVPGTVTVWLGNYNNRVAISQRFIITNGDVPELYFQCAEIL